MARGGVRRHRRARSRTAGLARTSTSRPCARCGPGTGERPSGGKIVVFEDCISLPHPTAGHVPIVIGGHSDVAARRAGRLGDGYVPAVDAATIADGGADAAIGRLDELFGIRAGRPRTTIATPRPSRSRSAGGGCEAGRHRAPAALGVSRIVAFPPAADPATMTEQFARAALDPLRDSDRQPAVRTRPVGSVPRTGVAAPSCQTCRPPTRTSVTTRGGGSPSGDGRRHRDGRGRRCPRGPSPQGVAGRRRRCRRGRPGRACRRRARKLGGLLVRRLTCSATLSWPFRAAYFRPRRLAS